MRKSAILFLWFLSTLTLARDKQQNWLKVQSPHFLVITNGSEKQGRHAADQFERMRLVFHTQFPSMHVDPASPIVVIATKEDEDFRALEPTDYLKKGSLQLAGLFLRAADKNYILMRLDAQGEHPYATVYHEYTHLITSRSGEWLPLWLNEGWAEFYQTTEIRDKEALLGQPSRENLMLLRQSSLLPLTVLLTVDHNSPYYHEENKGSIFYAESWVLTHFLTIQDVTQHKHLLDDYIVAVSKGKDSVTAATQAWGDLEKMDQTLQNYVHQNAFSYFKLPATTQVDDSSFKVDPVPAPKADAIRADFLAYDRREDDSRALLEKVLREDPDNAHARETMGFLEFQHGHRDEALKWYGQAVKLNSQSFLAHYYYGVIAMRQPSLSAADEAQIESSLQTANKLNPEFAPAYDALANFYAMRQRNLDDALMLSRKAIQMDAGNLNFRLNSANILMEMERPKDAETVLQAAQALAKNAYEQERVRNELERVQGYETMQAQEEKFKTDPAYQSSSNAGNSSGAQNSETAPSDSAPPKLIHRFDNGNNSRTYVPRPRHEGPVAGTHRFVTGTIEQVHCAGLGIIDFVVDGGRQQVAMHSENYSDIIFTSLGFTPSGDLLPCSQIEGHPAKVEFIEPTDKSIKDRIVAVELHK